MTLIGTYNPYLVALSISVACLASYTALDLGGRIMGSRRWAQMAWLATAAMAMGGGIWSMHFIGMLAFVMPISVTYDLGLTLLSLVIAIGVTGFGFFMIGTHRATELEFILSGIFMGIGIVSMHYTGMAAMRMPADIRYDPILVTLSVLIAIGASIAALWLAFRATLTWQWLLAAVVMGSAISGMHYTGMAAATFIANPRLDGAHGLFALSQTGLALGIATITFLILLLALVASAFDKKLVQRSRELDERNRQLCQANDELMAVYEQGLFASHCNMEGTIVHANRAAVEDLGFARADIIGKPFWEAGWWHLPETQELIRKAFERAAAGAPFRGELSYALKDGTVGVTDIALIPIKDGAGHVTSVFVPGTDITDRARQYRATFENAAVGIAHLSPDVKWLRVNRTFARIVGYSPDELVSKSVQDITHPDDFELSFAEIKRLHSGKADSYEIEKRYVRKDGTPVWVHMTGTAVRRKDGSIDHFVTVIEDISERKRTEEELHKSEERFKAAIERSPVPVLLFDDQEKILVVNQSWLQQSGYSRDELRTIEDWTARAYGECSQEVLAHLREIISTEPEVRRTELMVRTKGGLERHWSFVTSALGAQPDGRRLFISMAQDTTERKAYEERIEMLMREARHRTKNILGLVQAVFRQTAATEPKHFVESFAERVQALAANQDLLDKDPRQGADIEDLVHVQLAHFADLAGSRIVVHGPKLRLNAAAAQAVGLAVHELATNAGKYGALSTDAGRIDVDWRSDADSFAMSWVERGGPPVRPPERRGFGSTVIESMAKRAVDGEVRLEYDPSGVSWHLTCPATNALELGGVGDDEQGKYLALEPRKTQRR